MKEKDINKIYDTIEQNKKKYDKLMESENGVENAIKFNRKLNERIAKLGINTCKYEPKEDDDGARSN